MSSAEVQPLMQRAPFCGFHPHPSPLPSRERGSANFDAAIAIAQQTYRTGARSRGQCVAILYEVVGSEGSMFFPVTKDLKARENSYAFVSWMCRIC